MNYVERPAFSEGQLLSAADLQLTVDYPRGELETHAKVAHTSGVVDGMQFQFVPPVAPGKDAALYVAPGLAVDDIGRQIIIGTAMVIVADPLAAQLAGDYPAYVWYSEAPVAAAGAVMNPCAGAGNDIIRESANVGVFASSAGAKAQVPDAVCLGYVHWTGTAFEQYSGSDDVRQGSGVRAYEIVGPEHLTVVHGEDTAATTLSVQGTVEAVASKDETAPAISITGGPIVLAPGAASLKQQAPPSSTVSLAYFKPPNATGNGLVINLGDNDSTSELAVFAPDETKPHDLRPPERYLQINSQSGTVLASIDGTGTFKAAAAVFGTVNATTSIVVKTGSSTLTLGAAPPSNTAGIIASGSLSLAFGSDVNDQVTFVGGTSPVATINANSVSSNGVQIGTLDATNNVNGLGITNAYDLEIRTNGGDLLLNPKSQSTPPFRLTSGNRLINQSVTPYVDVTPLIGTGSTGDWLALGSFTIAFGTVSFSIDPLSEEPNEIQFPMTFTAAPAFFVTVCGTTGLMTLGAVATAVTPTNAHYRVTRLRPDTPTDGQTATWSDAQVDVTVSWIALGQGT